MARQRGRNKQYLQAQSSLDLIGLTNFGGGDTAVSTAQGNVKGADSHV
jgi:hypothetical protein